MNACVSLYLALLFNVWLLYICFVGKYCYNIQDILSELANLTYLCLPAFFFPCIFLPGFQERVQLPLPEPFLRSEYPTVLFINYEY